MSGPSGPAVMDPKEARSAAESLRIERQAINVESLFDDNGVVKIPDTLAEAEVLCGVMIATAELYDTIKGQEPFMSKVMGIDTATITLQYEAFKRADFLKSKHGYTLKRGWGERTSDKGDTGCFGMTVGQVWQDTYGVKSSKSKRAAGLRGFSSEHWAD